jgi:hypothetical protein
MAWQLFGNQIPSSTSHCSSTKPESIYVLFWEDKFNSFLKSDPFSPRYDGMKNPKAPAGILWVGWIPHSESKGSGIFRGYKLPCEDLGSSDVTPKFKTTSHTRKPSSLLDHPGSWQTFIDSISHKKAREKLQPTWVKNMENWHSAPSWICGFDGALSLFSVSTYLNFPIMLKKVWHTRNACL